MDLGWDLSMAWCGEGLRICPGMRPGTPSARCLSVTPSAYGATSTCRRELPVSECGFTEQAYDTAHQVLSILLTILGVVLCFCSVTIFMLYAMQSGPVRQEKVSPGSPIHLLDSSLRRQPTAPSPTPTLMPRPQP